ncbi:dihydrofolate reductase family protein [Paenibacillus arenilitoris]|uniref:Dihydrofolate reductase family protein n=1 Tax=Paenibacillus arenilitoris TaxID=2772299 RepID=A0A927CPT5_9BACL|nr:dihydrofolate reductase family protein [Paenibacillus arenilitoris]MBD2870862.1 dihydrofolate reductase family protein [Paenibacillus arenilitoris]
MKTMIWATLTANGNYAQSGPENPPRKEALDDFAAQAKAAGNFIVGRKTFEAMQNPGRVSREEQAAASGPFAELDIVVLSRSIEAIPGVKVAESPREALDYLRQRGHQTALVSGGADIHNAFLGQGLADEAIFNVAPVLEGKGLNLLIDEEAYGYRPVRLLDCKPLGGGVVQLRYAIDR